MNRAKLISLVAQRANISDRSCEEVLKHLTDTITDQMALGEKITISGFGTFETKLRKSTIARNPKTGELMDIAEQNVATFRAGTNLKGAVKSRKQ
jgi:DNA-binding protein HU-beta